MFVRSILCHDGIPWGLLLMEWLYYVNIMLLIYRLVRRLSSLSVCDSLSLARSLSVVCCQFRFAICVRTWVCVCGVHHHDITIYHFLPSNLNFEYEQPQPGYSSQEFAAWSIWMRKILGCVFSLSSPYSSVEPLFSIFNSRKVWDARGAN